MIIIGVSIMLSSVLSGISAYFQKDIYMIVGTVLMVIGLVVGIGVAFYAMIKYNKGIF